MLQLIFTEHIQPFVFFENYASFFNLQKWGPADYGGFIYIYIYI